MEGREISKAVITRLPRYYRYLEELLVFSLKEHPIQNERVFVDQADAGEAVRYAKGVIFCWALSNP